MTEQNVQEQGFRDAGTPLLRGLFDDAAVFPPGNAPLIEAVAAHSGHRTAWYSEAVGPLVLPDSALDDLAALLAPDADLELAVTIRGGVAEVPNVLEQVAGLPVVLRALELPLGAGAGEVSAAVSTLAELLPEGVDAYVEVPRGSDPRDLLDAIVEHGLYAKFRTGGLDQALYPDDDELTDSLAAAVAAGARFKATAGLHHPMRNVDTETGLDQHGFLNLLLSVDALLLGAERSAVRALLAERDPEVIVAGVRALGAARLERARGTFVSFGTCSMSDPISDLVDLGLIARPDPRW